MKSIYGTVPSPNEGGSVRVSGLAEDTDGSHAIEVEVLEEDRDVPPLTLAQHQLAASILG